MCLCPTIYTTVRTFFLGSFPDSSIYSIAGQMEWVNLLFEVINESILLPLFFFMGSKVLNKNEINNRLKTGLIIVSGVYIVFLSILMSCVTPLLKLMAADKTIIAQSATYIRIECVGNLFNILLQFCLVALLIVAKDWYVYVITGVKLAACLLLDTFLTSNLSCSAKLGVNGIAITNIIVNFLLWISVLLLLLKAGINIFKKQKLNFSWYKEFGIKGAISGAESLVRNLAYMVMVLRMVNVVSESGTYWVANNFIWGWLIMPATQLAELIKQNISKDKDAIRKYTLGYILITFIIVVVASCTIPAWKMFFLKVLNQKNYEKVFNCAIILFVFLILYVFQNVFDATFYGLGKIHYMLFETICTNCTYYVIMFILYKTGVFKPTLTSVCWMFVGGQALDTCVSLGVYIYLLKKYHIDISDINCLKTNYFKYESKCLIVIKKTLAI